MPYSTLPVVVFGWMEGGPWREVHTLKPKRKTPTL